MLYSAANGARNASPVPRQQSRNTHHRAPNFANDPMKPGSRIGPFEIVAALGSGGMGEVYHAIDTRLERGVAIKILPAEFSTHTERLLRFEQEAKSASALNHPNIVTSTSSAATARATTSPWSWSPEKRFAN